jgi:hypothetical protein
MTAVPRLVIPTAVIMGRRMVHRSGWTAPSWRVVGLVAGDEVPDGGTRGVSVHRDEDEEHFLWGGFRLELYRDATEAYWSNLVGQQPSLFVLCEEKEDRSLVPRFVTADMHEASSATEGQYQVFATAIPPEVYRQLEHFVVEHHVPEQKHKRKRADWTADEPS